MKISAISYSLVCAVLIANPTLSQANTEDSYPSRTIRLVVPFSPGGAADNNMRIIGHKLSERLGQTVMIDNKPGAAGAVAIQAARQAPKDGYTILYTSVSTAVTSAKPNAPYDLAKDFVPVIQTNKGPLLFYVRPEESVYNMQDLIKYIKSSPGALNYATIGIGSGPHLAMEYLKQVYDLDILHVPYKSSSQSSGAVIAGLVQVGIDPLSAVVPLIKSEKVRPIAVTSAEKSDAYPSVPGMKESGLPKYEFISWAGVSVMPGTPDYVVKKLNRELNEVLKDPDVIKSYEIQAGNTVGGTPQDYQNFVEQEVQRLRNIIKTGNLQLD
ncbi:MAG TPA: tripartite tricarboxylate transporter substrate-binding protein [Eoetvoesiella sp.]